MEIAVFLDASGKTQSIVEPGIIKVYAGSKGTCKITIKDALGSFHIHEPGIRPNNFNDKIMDVVPLRIEFYLGKVKINETEYNIYDNTFFVDKFVRKII